MGQFTEAPKRGFTPNAAISQFIRVKLLSTGKVDVAGAADTDIGQCEKQCFTADVLGLVPVPVRLATAQGTCKMVASGAVTVAAKVYQAASGKVTATSGTTLVGTAISAASADGDVIEVMRTEPNAAGITDSTGGTPSLTFAAITAGGSYAQADMVAVKNALSQIAALLNSL